MSATGQNEKAQLGCGTLVLIAIIVMIFSGGRDSSQLKKEVRELNEKIDRLERKVDALSGKLEANAPAQQRPAVAPQTTAQP